jgi:predicted membrane protein
MNSTEARLRESLPGRVLYSGPLRSLSLLAASVFCLAVLLFPQLLIDGGQSPNHGALVLGLWGMAAGFVHGVGFVPRHILARLALGPIAAWVLLITGSLLLFNF